MNIFISSLTFTLDNINILCILLANLTPNNVRPQTVGGSTCKCFNNYTYNSNNHICFCTAANDTTVTLKGK